VVFDHAGSQSFHWTYTGFEWDTVEVSHTVTGFQDWTIVNGVGFQSGYDNSPIVGDLQSIAAGLGGWLDMGSAGSMSIIANDIGTGDPMAGSKFTFETWFKKSGNPASNANFVAGPESTTAGIRTWRLELTTAGTLSFIVNDGGGTPVTVTTATALSNDIWYHVVGEMDGTTLRIFVNGVQDATAAIGFGSIRPTNTATGATMQITHAAVADIYLDETACYLNVALAPARVWAHYQAGALRGFRGGNTLGLSHLRANQVLDAVGSAAPRNIRTGTTGLQPAFQHGQDPLGELRKCALAEMPDGQLFVSKNGTITLLDAAHRSVSPWNTVQATFSDDGTVGQIPYLSLATDYSDSFIVNQWSANATGAAVVTVSDATSISTYGPRPQTLSELPITLAPDTILAALLAKYKDPMYRVTQIKPKMADTASIAPTLQLELGDKIRVLRTVPGGGARLDQTAWIQKIQVNGSPGLPLDVTLGVSPL
jgi:hypothetical protein